MDPIEIVIVSLCGIGLILMLAGTGLWLESRFRYGKVRDF